MTLLTGPPGSGKTHFILERLRMALREGRSDFQLLAPTATMAEHLRNEMAREGFVLRPRSISTLSKFIGSFVEDLPEVPGASLNLLVEDAVRRLALPEFEAVSDFAGLHAALAGLIGELASAGCVPRRFEETLRGCSRLESGFLSVWREVEASLSRKGMALRNARLQEAAERIRVRGLSGIRAVYLDGFFSLTDPELAVIEALGRHAEVVVTLPGWEGAEPARSALLRMKFREQVFQKVRPKPECRLVEAPSIEQEVEEIVRRILSEAEGGRPFREMGIVVRSPEPYGPVLETYLERFGIPVRSYFPRPLSGHAFVRYLSGLVDAMLGGWDHEQTLEVLRLPACGMAASPAMDRFEFEVRKRAPSKGLDSLMEMARDVRLRGRIGSLRKLEDWLGRKGTPAAWSERIESLSSFVRLPPLAEPDSHEAAILERERAEAVRGFAIAVREAAILFDPEAKIPLAEFWGRAKAVLRLATLRREDRRRNVVHILDVYEARQWELPVVFVCGLLERHFPLYHPQDPILPDESRNRLRRAGIGLRTSLDWEAEELFLFEFATTRATESLILSYPRFNQKGEENLRSFYVERFFQNQKAEAPQGRVRPEPGRGPSTQRASKIHSGELRDWLQGKHTVLSPTAIETFLQCPFQFFARYTLELQEPPPEPHARFDMLVQGNIVHATLARLLSGAGSLAQVFAEVFDDQCREANVPPGYRTEAVRLELYRNLQRFLEKAWAPPAGRSETERPFRFPLIEGIDLRGRIDRIDALPDGAALVIDYKYSPPEKVRRLADAHEKGKKVQGGLYLLALRQHFGSRPAGALFAGLRGDTAWAGWHVPIEGLQRTAESCVEDRLEELETIAIEEYVRA